MKSFEPIIKTKPPGLFMAAASTRKLLLRMAEFIWVMPSTFTSLFVPVCFFIFCEGTLAVDKSHCVSKELKLMSCRIKHQSTELGLSKEAIRVFDGTWRSVVKLPSVNEVTNWKSVKIRQVEKRKFLEMKVWQKVANAPDLEFEALHWKLFELVGTEVSLLADHVIQRRRRKVTQNEDRSNTFVVGKLESHMILVKGGELMWKVGHTKGRLSKDENLQGSKEKKE